MDDIDTFRAGILRDFLLKSATSTNEKSTETFEKKIRVMCASLDCIDALGENAPATFVNNVTSAFLNTLFSENGDVSIPDTVIKVFKSSRVEAALLAFVEANATKI